MICGGTRIHARGVRADKLFQARENGQALALALGLAGIGALSLVLMYNAGQTVSARARLTHTADAAAYSGALVQARALNLLSTINRAQVAHQVAMAHLVTLASWSGFAAMEAKQVKKGNPPLHVITMMFGLAQGLAYGASIASAGVDKAAANGRALQKAFGAHDRIVHDTLERASLSIAATLPKARTQAMRAVISSNYPALHVAVESAGVSASGVTVGGSGGGDSQADLTLTVLSDGIPGFLVNRDGNAGNGLRPLIETATERYGFLRRRDHIARNPWPVSYYCPFSRHELRRRGATMLDPWGRWQSDDTQSYHALRSNRWIGCYYREYPMGWGSAYGRGPKANTDFTNDEPLPENFSGEAFWRWAKRRLDFDIFSGYQNPLANARARRSIINWKQRGLPRHIVLNGKVSRAPLRFAVGLRQASSSLKTTDAQSAVRIAGGHVAYTGLGRHGAMSVVSAAETYYERPQRRADGRAEHGNLFRPYWQARLAASEPSERQWIARTAYEQ